MGGDDEKEQQIKGEIESKEGDPECLKFIRRSELSWSEAAKPTVSSLKYVQHTAAPLYKVCSAVGEYNFQMCKDNNPMSHIHYVEQLQVNLVQQAQTEKATSGFSFELPFDAEENVHWVWWVWQISGLGV